MSNLKLESSDPQNPEEVLQDSFQHVKDFSLLRLGSFNNSSPTNDSDHPINHPPCTACGCSGSNSLKRRSPSSSPFKDPSHAASDSDWEPKSKKQLFCDSFTLHGNRPVLRRCVSDSSDPPSAASPATHFQNPRSPESVITNTPNPVSTPSSAKVPTFGPSLPPLPPSLRRCVSDPTPTPSPPKTGLEDTPSGKLQKLKMIKDRLVEMQEWCGEVVREEEEEDENKKAEYIDITAKDESGNGEEEAVSVERAGESLIFHFKCPCKKGYQILLCGGHCYYKLL